MNTTNWNPYSYDLKFHIGELTVATIPFNVQRRVYLLEEIKKQLAETKLPPLDTVQQGYLLADIPTPEATPSFSGADNFLQYCLKSYMRCYIDMSLDFEQYQAKFSGKSRSGIRRKVRKFKEKTQGLDFRCYRTPEEVKQFFELARSVSAASYQERLLNCGLPQDPEYIAAAVDAAKHDNIRAFLLFADDKPVSYLYCPVENKVLIYAYLGYLPDYSRLSPGTVLQWLAMEELFAENKFTAFDFTEGDSEHKRFFSTHQIPCGLWLLLKPRIRNKIALAIHHNFSRCMNWFIDLLEKIHLKQKIKRWIRRTA